MSTNNTKAWLETQAGQQLQATLSNEEVTASLTRIVKRMDTLEEAVNRLADLLEQGPGIVSMVTDIADEGVRNASQQGIDIEDRLSNALVLAEKLTSPAMVEKLSGFIEMSDQLPGITSMVADMVDEGYKHAANNGVDIESRLSNALVLAEKLTAPEMVAKLSGIIEMSEQLPGIMSMLTDMVDEGYKTAANNGVDVESRLSSALALAEKLTAPEMVEKLNGIIEMSDQLPGIMSMVTDMVDEGYKNAAENGVDIEGRLNQALSLAEKLTAPEMVAKVEGLMQLADQAPGVIAMVVDMVDEGAADLQKNDTISQLSGLMNPQTLKMLGQISQALSDTQNQKPEKIGPFGAFRALRDPNMQQATGFLLNFGKNFGKSLNNS